MAMAYAQRRRHKAKGAIPYAIVIGCMPLTYAICPYATMPLIKGPL